MKKLTVVGMMVAACFMHAMDEKQKNNAATRHVTGIMNLGAAMKHISGISPRSHIDAKLPPTPKNQVERKSRGAWIALKNAVAFTSNDQKAPSIRFGLAQDKNLLCCHMRQAGQITSNSGYITWKNDNKSNKDNNLSETFLKILAGVKKTYEDEYKQLRKSYDQLSRNKKACRIAQRAFKHLEQFENYEQVFQELTCLRRQLKARDEKIDTLQTTLQNLNDNKRRRPRGNTLFGPVPTIANLTLLNIGSPSPVPQNQTPSSPAPLSPKDACLTQENEYEVLYNAPNNTDMPEQATLGSSSASTSSSASSTNSASASSRTESVTTSSSQGQGSNNLFGWLWSNQKT